MKRKRFAIFWISLLGLYLELLLIRWVGTEIRIFAYLQNTVLVVCFLGLGIGLFTSDRRASARLGILALVTLAAALVLPIAAWFFTHSWELAACAAVMSVFIFIRWRRKYR